MSIAINKRKVSEAFSRQSEIFDQLYTGNLLTEYMRSKFREELLLHMTKGGRVLELNCGTGIDTLYIAKQGFSVLAVDNSDGMLEQISKKVQEENLQERVQVRKADFEQLQTLQPEKFDHIYSNFSGLNCTAHLDKVLLSLAPLLNDGGKVSMVIMPKICFWENIMLLKGKFRTAFRRFGKKGAPAHIEGVVFHCYYYNPSYVMKVLKKDYDLVSLKGICITVPPPFIENFVERYPRAFRILKAIDQKIERIFPFTFCCDQYMITLQKR